MVLKVIDAHMHLGLRNMPEKCIEFLRKIDFENSLNMKPKDLILKNEEIEIEKIILVPSYPCGNDLPYDGFYEQHEWKGNHDEFLQWGTINPLYNAISIREELSKQYSLGIVGIKLHPVHHGYKPNDYRIEERNLIKLMEVYEFAEDYDLPLLIHTGTSITLDSRNKYGNPIYIDDVIKDFKIKIILAHAGRPLWTNEAFFLARSYENVYLEISSIPPNRIREYLPRIDELKDKVIYGSDFPNFKGHDILKNALEVAKTFDYDERIMRDNILNLIKIK